MRYAVIRGGDGLPPTASQLRGLAGLTWDVALQEEQVSPEGQRWILRRIERLERGDELYLSSLAVLQLSTLEALKLLRRLLAAGVTIRFAAGAPVPVLDGGARAEPVLAMLLDNERHRPSPATTARRQARSAPSLTRYQARYARRLLRTGMSLREVGLIFRMAPDALSRALEALADEPQTRTAPACAAEAVGSSQS